jgi:hypothetical protein
MVSYFCCHIFRDKTRASKFRPIKLQHMSCDMTTPEFPRHLKRIYISTHETTYKMTELPHPFHAASVARWFCESVAQFPRKIARICAHI